MTLQIIGFPRSNFVRTVRMIAHEKGIEYDYQPALPHSDEVKAIHPFGLIPVLRDGDVELAESIAIGLYLEYNFDGPKLLPEGRGAAAKVIQWMSHATTAVDQLIMRRYVVEYAFHKDADGNVVRDEIDRTVPKLAKMYAKLDKAVADGYFGSSEFTLADCYLTPIVSVANNFPEAKECFDNSENLKAYLARTTERKSFQETAS